ncbi:MAG: hypothetical protein M3155_09735 [Actinomycetota bacterium]|nr:hypothetical protein [Actinomycetota bacterium]
MRAHNPWLPALAALAFAVLFLVSGFVVPAPPDVDATAAQVQLYLSDHSGALAASGYLGVAGGVPFLIAISFVRQRLAGPGGWTGDTFYGGGLVVAAAATASLLIGLGLALHADRVAPDTARTLVDVQRFLAPAASGAVFAMALAAAVASLRYAALPRWVGLASAGYALYEVLESVTIFGDHGAFAPGGAINTIGTLAFLPWFVAVAAGLSRPAEEALAAPAVA